MRTHYLFPLLSGLLLTGLTACGDDSSESDTDDTADSGTDDATDDSDDADDTADDTDDTADDTDDTADDTDDTADDTDDTADDTDDTADDTTNEADGGDGGTGGDDDGVDGGDGGTGDDDGVDGGDGGTGGDDDGVDGGDGGVDAAPPLPEGACADSPVYDADGGAGEGAYADCDGTLNGGTCELTCADDFVGGFATCTDGVWSTGASCVALGTLDALIGDASDGAAIADAIVYVEGFFDPATQECADSDYCQVSDETGAVSFDAFPTGPQNVVIVKDGFDQIALPVEVAPEEARTVRLDALPTGFLDGNIVVLLGWEARGDVDLVLSVPAEGDGGVAECVNFDNVGSLDSAPFASLDHDSTGKTADPKAETIRIALNEDGTGPQSGGTYQLVVALGVAGGLDALVPSVRVIQAGDNGAAQVRLFELPEDAVADAKAWHVFDLYGEDGSLTAGGTTDDKQDGTSELPCVNETYDY